MALEIEKARSYKEGISYIDEGLNYILMLEKKEELAKSYSLCLYTDIKKPPIKVKLLDNAGLTLSKGIFIKGDDIKTVVAYKVLSERKTIMDRTARLPHLRSTFGKKDKEEGFCFINDNKAFDWKNDKSPNIKKNELVSYKIHVRGFTKGILGDTAGTFRGITEKIPYLKRLGINQIELMPIYEFDEIEEVGSSKGKTKRINYWGYKSAYYYAVKEGYAYDKANRENEFKSLVYECHKNKIEVILDFFFVKATNAFITDVIRYWLFNYHIDGVHISSTSFDFLVEDAMLYGKRLYVDYYDKKSNNSIVNSYNDGFLVSARRFIRGDEYSVEGVLSAFMPTGINNVNYYAGHNGFSIFDSFSYGMKHNEKNLLNNADGTEYNYSMNCGVEGKTRIKRILSLRHKLVKNALFLLLLARGTPLLVAGDEALRTQNGNNNAFCQDNDISYFSWNDKSCEKKEIFDFTRSLISFRKKNMILSCEQGLMNGKGRLPFPAISLHSEQPWSFNGGNTKLFGLLYNATVLDGEVENDLIYIVVNMTAMNKNMAIPRMDNIIFKVEIATDETIRLEKEYVTLPAYSCALVVGSCK